MKRNLIKGIVLISAVALSSCSATKLASLKSSAYDDDVYYTSAKAGDSQNIAVVDNQMSYNTDDDYFYYGDYASRINKFASYSPFSYTDNFYYSYVPYNNGFGAGNEYDRDYFAYNYGFGTQPNNGLLSNYVYSPYDYGYDPYSFGYDDFGYGDVYSAFLFGGGYYGGGGGGYSYVGTGHANWRHHNGTSPIVVAGNNPGARGARTGGSPGITRISALPGRPVLSVNPNTGTVTRLSTASVNGNINNQNNNINRQARDSFRPQNQTQTQSFSNVPAASSGGGGSAGAGGGGGGGGRPGRP